MPNCRIVYIVAVSFLAFHVALFLPITAIAQTTPTYPTQQEGLESLVVAPSTAANWNGPYLKKDSALKDPWGVPYIYQNPGQHGEVDVYTLGQDKAPGGTGEAQDVGSW